MSELMSETNRIPTRALLGGLAGWIPFWAPVALTVQASLAGRSPAPELALYTLYGALILSFLGGVRWGRALASDRPDTAGPWVLSLLPTCFGLAAILAHWAFGPVSGIALIIAGLIAQLAWDRHALRVGDLPAWYGQLRLILSLGAILAGLVCLALLFV